MDHSDKKTSEFERRASRRLSRGVTMHAGPDASEGADDDVYMAAMAMTVSDGFRPYVETTGPSAAAPNADHGPSPQAINSDIRRPSASDESHSTTAAAGVAASSVSSDASSHPSFLSSSSTSASQPSDLSVSATQQTKPAALSGPAPSAAAAQPRPVAARPSSIAKPPIEHAARSPSSTSASASSSGGNARPPHDVRASASSSVVPALEEEPYQGPSGPSFPYHMYPQNVRVTRTLSGITTSSGPLSDPSYTGPRRPAFPYSMYTQNTAAGPSAMHGHGVSVGFPGMPDNYQRRMGPDGEDVADLIGPDGHTEQLPPYTRYPDEAYSRKIAAANAQLPPDPSAVPLPSPGSTPMPASIAARNTVPMALPESSAAEADPTAPASPSTHTPVAEPSPMQAIPGAGGIGLASHNPEFDGLEDTEPPRSRYSLRSFNSDGSGHEINTAARNISEKRKHRAPHCIRRYGGRRILGIIPYWALCLVFTVLLIMGIILGSVIGTFVAKHKRAQKLHHQNNNPVSVTVTVDATPIPTPSNLAHLPTGTFGLPLQINESPGSCFNDTTQAQAWNCQITNQMGMTLSISSLPLTPNGPMYNISINCNESANIANDVFFYGEQAPTITPTPMQLVNDTLDPNRGPAWFKMLPYNKTVIVQESYLSVPTPQPTSSASSSSNNKKRGNADLTDTVSLAGPFGRKGAMTAQAGEKPWVCTWPDTILEIFIYPNQNTSLYRISLSSTYTPLTATPTPTPTTPTSYATGVSPSGAVATPTGTTAFGAPVTPGQLPNMPPPYPRVVKMEERRMANSPEATCVQYELKSDVTGLKAVPYLDANGQVTKITIAEVESGPSLFSPDKRDVFGAEDVFEKRDETGLSKCGCLWMVT